MYPMIFLYWSNRRIHRYQQREQISQGTLICSSGGHTEEYIVHNKENKQHRTARGDLDLAHVHAEKRLIIPIQERSGETLSGQRHT